MSVGNSIAFSNQLKYLLMKNLFFCLVGAMLFALAACSSEKADPEFYLEKSAFEVEGEGGSITVVAMHNVDYVVKVGASWITHKGTKGLNSGEEVFAVAENPDNDPREGSILFVSEEAGKSFSVTVKQLGLNAIFYTSFDNKVVEPRVQTAFGANIVSNTYSNGKGVIKFSGKVTEVGEEGFYNKGALTSIDLPNTIVKIGKKAFFGCEGITELVIPQGVTEIGEQAFDYCTALKKITLPSNITQIKAKTFYDCHNLTEIAIPAAVTAIGESAFMLCVNLEKINLPQGLVSLGTNAFGSCRALKEITLPSGITTIEKRTFSNCASLSSIGIPQGVTSIGESAFSGCGSLASVSLPANVNTIGKMAFAFMPVTKLEIPEGVKIFENNTVYSCDKLVELNLPSTLTEFRDELAGCESLASIRILASEPPLMAPGAPSYISELWQGLDYSKLKIYVPAASVETYKNAASWQKYVELISAIE